MTTTATAAQQADITAVRQADRGAGALASTVARVIAYPWKNVPSHTAEVTARLDALVAEGHLSKTGARYRLAR